jgi:hypothetical protein
MKCSRHMCSGSGQKNREYRKTVGSLLHVLHAWLNCLLNSWQLSYWQCGHSVGKFQNRAKWITSSTMVTSEFVTDCKSQHQMLLVVYG